MEFIITLSALALLMFVAYRGYSVILFAPLIAMGAVLLIDPTLVAPMFTGLFMDKMVGFIKLYFPVFLLGALFGKVIELSGFSKSITLWIINLIGKERAILAIVLVCAILTYGGVSLFVVVFAAYPFAAEMFREGNIPKRLIPATIALGSFTFSMDSLPGSPQIQNIIPTTFFKTDIYAAPWLGLIGGAFILICGVTYLEYCRRAAAKAGEGYGNELVNEPEPFPQQKLPNAFIAILPLLLVGILNKVFTVWLPQWYGNETSFIPAVIGSPKPIVQTVSSVSAIWAVEGALLIGVITVFLFAGKTIIHRFAEGSKQAISGALLATMNTASEYGFGAVIAALPGFLVVANSLGKIPNPLLNEALAVTTMAGITGSGSGGLSIALASMADIFISNATAAGIPMEVLHRVAAMASGGMDTLPHNGAVITVLAVTGLTHRQSYKNIFVITCIKTSAVLVVIATYYLTGLV